MTYKDARTHSPVFRLRTFTQYMAFDLRDSLWSMSGISPSDDGNPLLEPSQVLVIILRIDCACVDIPRFKTPNGLLLVGTYLPWHTSLCMFSLL